MQELQSFGPDIPPPPRKAANKKGPPRSPECEALVALSIGGYIVVPPERVTKALKGSMTSIWGRRHGMKFKTWTTAGDEGRGIAPGSLVIQRVG